MFTLRDVLTKNLVQLHVVDMVQLSLLTQYSLGISKVVHTHTRTHTHTHNDRI